MTLHVLEHPLVNKILTDLRDVTTPPTRFRELVHQLTYFLLIEATRPLNVKRKTIITPLTDFDGMDISDTIVAVPVLRAGMTMLSPAMEMLPNVTLGYIGVEGDLTTATARKFSHNLPEIAQKWVIVLDPMLATGESAEYALTEIFRKQPQHVAVLSVIASPEGVRRLENLFTDVPLFTGAIDERLDNGQFIVPGLGEFEERAFGVKQ